MNKTQIIAAQREDIKRLNGWLKSESALTADLLKQADAADKLHKRLSDQEKASHAAEKLAATEAATLKSIKDGFVPVEVLRSHIREEYKTTHNASFTKTDLTLMLDNKHAVDKAILATLLEKPVHRGIDFGPYANGGYTTPKVGDRVGVYYCGNN